MYRFAVIGYGFIGRRHVKNLKSFSESDCAAVCDIEPLRLEEAKEAFPDLHLFRDAKDLFSWGEFDTVLISANNNQHKKLTIMAAEAGKHVIVEKPAALSVAEFDEMTAACEKAGVTLTVHQQRRLDKDFDTVRQCVQKKLVGDVYTVQSRLFGYNGNMHDWHVYKSEGGGMLYDWGVHLIDQVLYMMGDAKLRSIYADVRNVINQEVDDYFLILLRFDNGITAVIELGTYILSDQKDWFERHWFVGGNKGSMYVNKFEPEGAIVTTSHLLQNVPHDQDKSAASYGPTRSFGVPEPGLIQTRPLPETNADQKDFYRYYFEARDGKREMFVRPQEVRRVLSVMEAVRASAETGKSISFE